MKEQKKRDLREYLKDKGIAPSYHRLKILEYLMKSKTHPTADMIYKDLSKEIPTLSKTTVYNTLNLFAKKKIISALTIEENELRYDFKTEPHAHFKCIECGNIYDIDLEFPEFEKVLKDHKVLEYHLYFKGICKKCLKK